MNEWTLAAFDIQEWINTIIFLVIIFGSIFTSIAKTLIKKFSPPEQGKTKRSASGKIDKPIARPMPTIQTRQQRPFIPVAKPLTVQPEAKPTPPKEMPIELPEILAEVFPELIAPRKTSPRKPEPQRPAPIPQQPTRPSSPATQKTRIRSRQKRRVVTEAVKPAQPKPIQETTESRLGRLTSMFDQKEDLLGHLGTNIDPHPGTDDIHDDQENVVTAISDDWLLGITRPSRRELQKAIVMNEILSPPLALRPCE